MEGEWKDIRCLGTRRNGLPCNQLLQRVKVHTVGVWETKCPRCKTIRIVRVDGQHTDRKVG